MTVLTLVLLSLVPVLLILGPVLLSLVSVLLILGPVSLSLGPYLGPPTCLITIPASETRLPHNAV